MKLGFFFFQSPSNEKKKNRIFQSKEKNFLISLLKIAEHRLKEKDDFLRKILMFEKEYIFPVTFSVCIALEEFQYLNFILLFVLFG